jgi:hypothetical protein
MGNKSKYSKEQRKAFLKAHGVVFARHGRGDHDVWVHEKLRDYVKEKGIHLDCPANLLTNPAQLPWEQTVPLNPATGTWAQIASHVKWCDETYKTLSGAEAAEEARKKRKQEFLDARDDICQWKHETKHRLRAGLDANPAPESYQRLSQIKAQL